MSWDGRGGEREGEREREDIGRGGKVQTGRVEGGGESAA